MVIKACKHSIETGSVCVEVGNGAVILMFYVTFSMFCLEMCQMTTNRHRTYEIKRVIVPLF